MSEKHHEYFFTKAVAEVKGFSIFMLDADGIIKTWNNGCELMKGYTAEEVIGQNFDILFPEFLKEQGLHEKERQLAKENGRYETENWRKRKSGELFWAYVVLTPVYDDNEKHTGFIKITQDQTEKKACLDQLNANIEETKAINEKLEVINSELIKSNAILEEFAYASSHDLQAPLRKISVFTERLRAELSEQLNDEQRNSFNRINRSTVRMLTLIKNLLNYSSIEMGMGNLQEIDLNTEVKEVLEDLELEIAEKSTNCQVGKLPAIKGNKQQCQQLFQNLIGNSLKYTKPGVTPEIEISAYQIKGSEVKRLPVEVEDKMYHLIQVKDNGIGFEQEKAKEIFKVFTRLNGSSDYTGSGVGLSIVQKVVDNHQGYVWAESIPGEGATFKILLPLS